MWANPPLHSRFDGYTEGGETRGCVSNGMLSRPPQTCGNTVSHSLELLARFLIPCRQRAMIPISRSTKAFRDIWHVVIGPLLVVAHAQHDDAIRIITARLATRAERKLYEEG